MRMPRPISGKAKEPTGFNFERRDSLGVTFRPPEVFIKETIDWLKKTALTL